MLAGRCGPGSAPPGDAAATAGAARGTAAGTAGVAPGGMPRLFSNPQASSFSVPGKKAASALQRAYAMADILTRALVEEREAGKDPRVLDIVPGRDRLAVGGLRHVVIEPDIQTRSASVQAEPKHRHLLQLTERSAKVWRGGGLRTFLDSPGQPGSASFFESGRKRSPCCSAAGEIPRGRGCSQRLLRGPLGTSTDLDMDTGVESISRWVAARAG